MKRHLIFLSFCLVSGIGLAQQNKQALQEETSVSADTLTTRSIISFEGRNYREYDGFLLDMNVLQVPAGEGISSGTLPPAFIHPSFLYNPFANYRTEVTDYTYRFRHTDYVSYGTVSGAGIFSHNPIYGSHWNSGSGFNLGGTPGAPGFVPFGFGPAPQTPNLRSATFRLNNGWRITTYGEYDADGHKVRNPSALPGQRNTFNGAFEMKSENGNFGIRIGVQRY